MAILRLSLRMFWRDLRAGELHLLGLALVLAVASLSSVGFLSGRIGLALEREAAQLLGGDLLLKSDHPWSVPVRQDAGLRGLRTVDVASFSSMALGPGGVELVGVKAVAPGYPLRGALRVADAPGGADAPAPGVPGPGEAWVDERLLSSLGLEPGDAIGLGELRLRVSRIVTHESDRGANFFAVLPRVLINGADLAASGLIQEGSRVSWLLQVAGEADAVAEFRAWLAGRLERGQAVESVEQARPELRSALDQARRFLQLAALLTVILAAVAVVLTTRRFLQRHLDACAMLRCFGVSGRRLVGLVLLEFLIMAGAAWTLGASLGWLLQWSLGGLAGTVLGVALPATPWQPWAQGLVAILLLLAGSALPQLLRLRRVPALAVIRRELAVVEPATGLAWGAAALALAGLLVWVAGEWRLGLLVAAGFVLVLGGFWLVAWLAVRGLGPLGRGRMGWRQGLAALDRRAGFAALQVSALGVGLAALLVLTLVRGDLIDHWRRAAPPDAPNRFLVNIQPEQQGAVEALFRRAGLPVPELAPMIRGRLLAVNGRPVGRDDYPEERARRLVEREFNLSRGSRLQAGNRVVAGRWHGASPTPQFSVEKGLAQTLGLALGDRVTFEVAGRRVEAPITSVRELNWDSMRVNFFVTASPGLLDDEPASLITSFRLPPGQVGFTRELVAAFPNLSVIDVSAVLAQLQAMMERLMGVVEFIFAFAILAGAVVLWAALQATHDERGRELALLRVLGGRNRQLRQALLMEFATLGVLAGSLAGVGASALGWVIARQAFHLEGYLPGLSIPLTGVVAGMAGVTLLGWLGTRGLLRNPPLATLRALA